MTTMATRIEAEADDLGDDRLAALADRPAVGEGPAELLLEREEEPGREGERGEPQRRDRVELVLAADGPRADLEEGVGGDAGDEQRGGDRERCPRAAGCEWSPVRTRGAEAIRRARRDRRGTPAGTRHAPCRRGEAGGTGVAGGISRRQAAWRTLLDLRLEQLDELLLQRLQALGGHHGEADADVGGVAGEAGDLLDARQLDVGRSTFGRSNFGSSNFGSSNLGSSNLGSSNFGKCGHGGRWLLGGVIGHAYSIPQYC